MDFFTYITSSRRNGTLYTGSTDSLLVRAAQHKSKRFSGFTARHGVDLLVWFERHPTRDAAFRRERQIKKWNRPWKLRLIEELNPDWNDLAEALRLGDLKDAKDWIPASAGMGGKEEDDDVDH
ncbi:GIY-YIG nuclease family protein [Brevundimonas sp.]